MDSRTRILLLFDNNGNEYVSRIQEGASRFCRTSGVPLLAENLYPNRPPISDFLDAGNLAGPAASVAYAVAANWKGSGVDLRAPVLDAMHAIGEELRRHVTGRDRDDAGMEHASA